LLLKQSKGVKEIFQFRSLDYGHLKYEMRRVVAYYNHGRHHRPMDTSHMLAIKEVLELSPDVLRYACTKLSIEENRQKQFFSSWVKRVRTTFKQLELLLEDNNSLLDKLGVLHYPVEETKHIARRDRLFQSHTNLDFLMKDLCDEISASLSSRLVANFSK
jgi:mevalonate kinase